MNGIVCYIATKEDEQIAKNLNESLEKRLYDKEIIAALRGAYDTEHPDANLDVSDINKASRELLKYKRDKAQERINEINAKGSNMHESFNDLISNFTAEQRFNRVSMVTTLISDIVDRVLNTKGNEGRSREDIFKGFKRGSDLVYGQFALFDKVYNDLFMMWRKAQLLSQANIAPEKKDTYRYQAKEFKKVLDNWGAIVTYARARLRNSEGIKLGNNISYGVFADSDNFDYNDLSEYFNPEENTKESWQESNDMKSAFGTVGRQVRYLISRMPQMELQDIYDDNGNVKESRATIVKDDIGFTKYLDPVHIHQTLLDILRGIGSSETAMMKALDKKKKEEPWIENLLNRLKADSQLRTQFLVDFKRNFQPYSILKGEYSTGEMMLYTTPVINKQRNTLDAPFMARIKRGKTLSSFSVYNNQGTVERGQNSPLTNLINEIQDVLAPSIQEGESTENVFKVIKKYGINDSKFFKMSALEKRNFLTKVSRALGIDLSDEIASRIVSSKMKYKYGETLLELSELLKTTGTESGATYTKFLNDKVGKTDSRPMQKISALNSMISNVRGGFIIDSRARYVDKNGKGITLFSNVNPSYMGDKIEKIKSFVEDNDKEGLRKYIEDEYLHSSFFKDEGGNILNTWLEEIIKACDDSKPLSQSFVAQLDYQRFLGSQDNNFENFTSRQHAISMLHQFAADKLISNYTADTALYPVFILGDSGVAKYIRAKRYSADEIIDKMVLIYRQERRRMAQVRALNKFLDAKNQEKKVKYYATSENEFTLLPWLNENAEVPYFEEVDTPEGKVEVLKSGKGYYYNKYIKGRFDTIRETLGENSVRDAIKEYMRAAMKQFEDKLRNEGVLETVNTNKGTKYKYLSQLANTEKAAQIGSTEKAKMEGRIPLFGDFLQEFFYNTKFATIQQIELMTIDPAFFKDVKDLQKRYKAIHAPGTILSLEALDFKGNKYSKDGIERAVYFNEIKLDSNYYDPVFMSALRKHFGENSKIYRAYNDNTLTDGQGYRTLRSYRKVKGMAGQWTRQDERAYERIQAIREKGGKLTEGDLMEIAKLAVVFQPIKATMFTHEHVRLNGEEGDRVLIPVYHKYAEAVIIPELLPKGNRLRDLAEWMDNHTDVDAETGEEISTPIDLITCTSAVKVGGFGSFELKGTTDAKSLDDAIKNAYVHNLSYEDYRIQTNVPEHIYNSQLFGTQIRKLIMANVIKYNAEGALIDSDYSRYINWKALGLENNKKINLGKDSNGNDRMVDLTGKNLVSFYNSLIIANILDSIDIFDLQTSDSESISDVLIQNIINNNRESLDNILAYSLNDDGEINIPLFEGALEHDSSSLLLSLFRKIVNKQTILGGSAVQVSAMGIDGYKEDGGLSIICEDEKGNIIRINDDMTEEEKNEAIASAYNPIRVEIEAPFDFSFTDENGFTRQLEYHKYCNTDGTLKKDKDGVSLLEKKLPGCTNIIAYRIPTENSYSMINAEIVRFTPKTAGGTIKVPHQCTTIAGFDFDIDKLYFMRREYHVKERIENADGSKTNIYWQYDPRKSALEQIDPSIQGQVTKSRAVRNNMLIDLIQKRLEDPETMEMRYTPGGFKNAIVDARMNKELLFGDIESIIDNNGNIDFEALKARSTNKNIPDPEPEYDYSDPWTIMVYNQQNQVASKLIGIFANQNTNHAFASLMKKFSLNEAIEFAGHGKHDGYGYDLLHAPEGVNVALTMAELLAASVDAVKQPVLNFLNFNTVTASSGALLARLGYSTFEIGLLLNQPIIHELSKYILNTGLTLDIGIKELTLKYLKENGSLKKGEANVDYSLNQLALNIYNYRNNNNLLTPPKNIKEASENSFVDNQMKVLALFKDIAAAANEVTSFINATKYTAGNAVKSTFGDMYEQQMRLDAYLKFRTEKKTGEDTESMIDMEVYSKDSGPSVGIPINNKVERLEYLRNKDIDSKYAYMRDVIDNPFAYEQTMYDANRVFIKSMSKYFPYENDSYTTVRNAFKEITKNAIIDGDTINSMHREFIVYLLSQQEFSDFNGEGGEHIVTYQKKDEKGKYHKITANVDNRTYYNKHFVNELFNALEENKELKNSTLFKYLDFYDSKYDSDALDMAISNVGGLERYVQDSIKEAWAALYNENPRLATDLYLYNFYKMGYGFSPFAFMNLAPTAIKEKMVVKSEENVRNSESKTRTYVDFLREIFDDKYDSRYLKDKTRDFLVQYIANHSDNTRFVYNVKNTEAKKAIKRGDRNKIGNSTIELDFTSDNNAANMFIMGQAEDSFTFRFALMIDGNLYIADRDSNGTYENKNNVPIMTYRKVDIQGEKNTKVQYFSKNSSREGSSIVITDDPLSKEEGNADPSEMKFEHKDPEIKIKQDNNEIIEQWVDAFIEARSHEQSEEFRKRVRKYNQGELNSRQELIRIQNMIVESVSSGLDDIKADLEFVNKIKSEGKAVALDYEGNFKEIC